MDPRRTLPLALVALALVASAAGLPSPAAQQDQGSEQNGSTDGSSYDENGSDNDTYQNGTDAESDGTSSSEDGDDGTDRGGPDDGDDRRPSRTGPEDREVELEVEDDRAEFRSEARDDDARTELRIRVEGDDASMSLDFESRADDRRTELAMDLRHPLLTEFRDADGDGVRDPGEPAVQVVDLREIEPTATTQETEVGPEVTIAYSLPRNGTFAADVLLPSGPARVGDQEITPDEAKVDFRVEGFPFEANDTALSLQVEVDARFEGPSAAVDASGVTLRGDGAAGYFRWVPTVQVDGATRDVHPRVDAVRASAEDGEARTEHVIHLAYPQGETIVHDPTFGVESVEEAVRDVLGHVPAYAGAALATAALAVGIALARTRRP